MRIVARGSPVPLTTGVGVLVRIASAPSIVGAARVGSTGGSGGAVGSGDGDGSGEADGDGFGLGLAEGTGRLGPDGGSSTDGVVGDGSGSGEGPGSGEAAGDDETMAIVGTGCGWPESAKDTPTPATTLTAATETTTVATVLPPAGAAAAATSGAGTGGGAASAWAPAPRECAKAAAAPAPSSSGSSTTASRPAMSSTSSAMARQSAQPSRCSRTLRAALGLSSPCVYLPRSARTARHSPPSASSEMWDCSQAARRAPLARYARAETAFGLRPMRSAASAGDILSTSRYQSTVCQRSGSDRNALAVRSRSRARAICSSPVSSPGIDSQSSSCTGAVMSRALRIARFLMVT